MPDLIPIGDLTDKENSVVGKMLETFYKAGTLETVSEERTKKIYQIALDEGCNAQEAGKLTRHFNAATEEFKQMPAAVKEEVYAMAKKKLSGPSR